MPDTKISELDALPAPALTDLLAVVSDPAGTPATKMSTLAQVFAADLQRPSSDEKAALAGSADPPSAANPFATVADLTDVAEGLDALVAAREPADPAIQAHLASAHAPADAQKNSDITQAEIEAKLTGEITSHSHAGSGGGSSAWADITGTPTTLDGYGINGQQVLEVGSNGGGYAGLTLRSVGASVGSAFRFMYNATDYGGLYFNFGSPESLVFDSKQGKAIWFAQNGLVHHELSPSGVTKLARNQGTTLGTSQLLELRDTMGNNSGRVEIAMGYRGGTYFPVVIGSLVTSDVGQEANALYFATRAMTTDTAAIERVRIHASGGVSIGDATDPGNTNLRVVGAVEWGGGPSIASSAALEPADPAIQAHLASAHAPADAQKNSDITQAEIEAKLTGEITSHSHPGMTVWDQPDEPLGAVAGDFWIQ